MRALKTIAILLLAIIAGVCVYGATDRPQVELPAELQGSFIDVDGLRTRYLQAGSGPDVLLIHGSPGSVEDWAPVIDLLAPHFHVTAYDRPGNGYTDAATQYDYAFNADFAADLIAKLQLHDVVVAGHSFGGTTALAVGIRHPEVAKGIVVVDSATYFWARRQDPVYRLLVIPYFGQGLARLAGPVISPKKVRAGLEAIFPNGVVPSGFAEKRIPIWTQPKVSVEAARESLGAPAQLTALSPRYHEIRRPVFIIAQGDDPRRRKNAEHLHADVAGSQLEFVSGTGHYIQFAKPEAVAELIGRAAGTQ